MENGATNTDLFCPSTISIFLHVGLKMVFTLNKLNSDEMANKINILNKTKWIHDCSTCRT